jgi:hypothetical protein
VQHLLSYYVVKIEGSNQPTPELPLVSSLNEKDKTYFRDIAIKYFGEKCDLASVSEEQIIALGQRFIAEVKKGQKQETERQFFTTRAVELMKRQGVPKEIPPVLARAISVEYQKIGDDADKSEIETIYKISQATSGVDFGAILRSYLKDKPLSDYHAESLMFADNDLQMKVFDQIKTHKDYDKLIKESPKFRAKMREAVPQLFLDFSPGTKPEDAMELKHLAGKSRLLSRYESMIDSRKPSEERINGFFEKARQALRAVNPKKYDASMANLDNYQLIKQYDRLDRELRS